MSVGPITITPKVILIWDGKNAKELGISHLLVSATIGSTCERSSKGKRQTGSTSASKTTSGFSGRGGGSSKRPKFFTRRAPRVSCADLTFIVPNQAYATYFMELIGATGRPTIGIGFQVPEYAGGQGIMIGSFKMDTIDWDYSSNGHLKLNLKGKSDALLGVAKYKAPRNFEKTTFKEVVEAIAKDHDLTVEFDSSEDKDLQVELNVFSPSGESDFDFLDRVAEAAGYSGFQIDSYDSSANANKVMRFSKAPTYLVNRFERTPIPKVALAYGPGITGQEELLPKGFVILKVADMKVTMPQSNAAIPTTATIATNKKTSSIKTKVPKVSRQDNSEVAPGGIVDVQTNLTSDSQTRATVRNLSSKATKKPSKYESVNAQGLIVRELPGKNIIERVFISGCPTSVSNDLLTAKRNGARARQMGYVEEISVTLNPGFPFIIAPMTLELFGSYVHDGMYGVQEVTHKYDDSSGLTTDIKLLRIRGAKASGKKKSPKDADGNLKVQVPEVSKADGTPVTPGGEVKVETNLSSETPMKGKASAKAKVKSTAPTPPPTGGN